MSGRRNVIRSYRSKSEMDVRLARIGAHHGDTLTHVLRESERDCRVENKKRHYGEKYIEKRRRYRRCRGRLVKANREEK